MREVWSYYENLDGLVPTMPQPFQEAGWRREPNPAFQVTRNSPVPSVSNRLCEGCVVSYVILVYIFQCVCQDLTK